MIFKIDNPIYDYCKTVCIVSQSHPVSQSAHLKPHIRHSVQTNSIEKRMKGKPVVSHKVEWEWKWNPN